jgi:hypothetical protein
MGLQEMCHVKDVNVKQHGSCAKVEFCLKAAINKPLELRECNVV